MNRPGTSRTLTGARLGDKDAATFVPVDGATAIGRADTGRRGLSLGQVW